MTQTRCKAIGYLTVGGREVGLLRCELDAGHEIDQPGDYSNPSWVIPAYEGTPHRAILEWADESAALDWPEANDPDEHFDVIVPLDAAKAERDARAPDVVEG